MTTSHDTSQEKTGGFLEFWCGVAGPGWRAWEMWINMILALFLGVGVALWAVLAGYGWTTLQLIAAGLVTWDITGGAIAYNTAYSKHARQDGGRLIELLPHNLIHIHPVVIGFFYSDLLPWVFFLWAVQFFFFVSFMEPAPRFSEKTVKILTAVLILVNVSVMAVAFFIPGASGGYAALVYLGMLAGTLLIHASPFRLKRFTAAIVLVIICMLAGMVFAIPQGFAWFAPVYLLKLLLGFSAIEKISVERARGHSPRANDRSPKRGSAVCILRHLFFQATLGSSWPDR